MIDLSQLPAPAIVETLDFEAILAARKARLIALYPAEDQAAIAASLALESEPLLKLLQENAYREMILRQRINEAALATMLAKAQGADLDQIAAHWDVERQTVQAGDSTAVPPVPEIKESDARLRYRTQLAMEALTVAGSRGAYEYHTLSASPRVAACQIVGPEMVWVGDRATSRNGVPPGRVMVYLLATDNGGVPDAGLLATVQAALSAELVRPLCDTPVVAGAEIIDYAVQAALWIYPGPSESAVLDAAQANAAAFTVENFAIGYDVRRSALFARLHVAGVQRVKLVRPAADLIIRPGQAARCTGINLTMGGRDV